MSQPGDFVKPIYTGIVLPDLVTGIGRISITLEGHQDLVLQISKRGVHWATELFHTSVPKALQYVWVGENAIVDACRAYNDWKAKEHGNKSPENNSSRLQESDSGSDRGG